MTSPLTQADTADGRTYGELLESMRVLQDRWTLSDPPASTMKSIQVAVEQLTDLLDSCQVGELNTPNGKRPDLPGRGSLLLVPAVVDRSTRTERTGRVTFRDFHRGGRSDAAHGGTHALLFDDVIGKLINQGSRPATRTAFLHVDYRAVVPVGVELTFEAVIDSEVGRKIFASGRLMQGSTVLAEAHGLWVELRPGQP